MTFQPDTDEVACASIRRGTGRSQTAVAWICGAAALLLVPFVVSFGTGAPVVIAAFASAALYVAGTLLSQTRSRGGTVRLIPGGIRVPGLLVARRVSGTEVESAYDTDGGIVLRLKSGATVELELMRLHTDLIRKHLGLTLDQAALTAPLRGMIGPFTRGLLATIAAWPMLGVLVAMMGLRGFAGFLGAIGSFVGGVLVGIVVASRLRPRVVVGVDGIRVIGVLRPVFVPYDQVVEARIVDQLGYPSLVVTAREAKHILPLVGQSEDEAQGLARRVAEGRARHREAAATRDLSVLDRAGMSLAAWRENLRRVPRESGGFRFAPLDQRDFEEVLRDPAAPIERRVGAALAMRESGRAALGKIRIAASTSAEPRVRIALECVAGEDVDEEAVDRALRAAIRR